MRGRFTVVSAILFMIVGVLFTPTRSSATTCNAGAHARCIMCNDTQLLCDGGVEGWTPGSTKADEIDITVHTANGKDLTYSYDNPLKGVGYYYGDLSENPEIVKFLNDQAGVRITPGMQVHAGSAFFRAAPTLSRDVLGKSNADSQGSASSAAGQDKNQMRCLYDSGKANLANGSSCGGNQVCIGQVTCMKAGKIVAKNEMAGCRSKNGGCPSASDCANDPSITVSPVASGGSGDLTPGEIQKSSGKGTVQ